LLWLPSLSVPFKDHSGFCCHSAIFRHGAWPSDEVVAEDLKEKLRI
jgi:hypothetical protein